MFHILCVRTNTVNIAFPLLLCVFFVCVHVCLFFSNLLKKKGGGGGGGVVLAIELCMYVSGCLWYGAVSYPLSLQESMKIWFDITMIS